MSPGNGEGRPGEKAAPNKINTGVVDGSILPDPPSKGGDGMTAVSHAKALVGRVDAAEPIRRRAVQDALSGALASQWQRRAATFEWAAHRPGIDYPGRASAAELNGQRARCLSAAAACRAQADMLSSGRCDEPWPGFVADLDSVMAEARTATRNEGVASHGSNAL